MNKPTRQQKVRAKARVSIAEDVIAQIKARRYVAQTGVYIRGINTKPIDQGKAVDLRSHLKRTLSPKKPCTVCALGSAFMSCVRIFDKFELNSKTADDDSIDYGAMRKKLREFFTPQELDAIESSFERSQIGLVRHLQWIRLPEGYKTFLRDLNAEDRLLWLMKAVVRIGGLNKITLKALEQQALLSIVLDPEYEGRRWSTLRPSTSIC